FHALLGVGSGRRASELLSLGIILAAFLQMSRQRRTGKLLAVHHGAACRTLSKCTASNQRKRDRDHERFHGPSPWCHPSRRDSIRATLRRLTLVHRVHHRFGAVQERFNFRRLNTFVAILSETELCGLGRALRGGNGCRSSPPRPAEPRP